MIPVRTIHVLGAAALALGLTTGIAPASAATSATIVGTGTMTPGLSPDACVPQRLTIDGTITGTDDRVEPVHFEGISDGCETADAGAGTGTFSGGLTGAVTYVRTGNVIMLKGAADITKRIKGSICTWLPNVLGTGYISVCVVW